MVFKRSSYLTETHLDPEFWHATEPTKMALNKAVDIEGDMWSWLEDPDNRLRLARFGTAMTGVKIITSSDFSTVCHLYSIDHHLALCVKPTGYGCEKLPSGSLVIDIGGGVGAQSLTSAGRHPYLHFIVQDCEAVIGDANEVSVAIFMYTSSCPFSNAVREEKHARRTRLWTREIARSVAFHPCISQRRAPRF